jgi:hypothetical protein
MPSSMWAWVPKTVTGTCRWACSEVVRRSPHSLQKSMPQPSRLAAQ